MKNLTKKIFSCSMILFSLSLLGCTKNKINPEYKNSSNQKINNNFNKKENAELSTIKEGDLILEKYISKDEKIAKFYVKKPYTIKNNTDSIFYLMWEVNMFKVKGFEHITQEVIFGTICPKETRDVYSTCYYSTTKKEEIVAIKNLSEKDIKVVDSKNFLKKCCPVKDRMVTSVSKSNFPAKDIKIVSNPSDGKAVCEVTLTNNTSEDIHLNGRNQLKGYITFKDKKGNTFINLGCFQTQPNVKIANYKEVDFKKGESIKCYTKTDRIDNFFFDNNKIDFNKSETVIRVHTLN